MKHKYKLGDYVEYYTTTCKIGGKTEYINKRKGFINSIEEMILEDNSIVSRYSIGQYIGGYGHIICEEAIIGKLETPKYKSKLEYLKTKVMVNEAQIKSLKDENKSLNREIAKLEKESLK